MIWVVRRIFLSLILILTLIITNTSVLEAASGKSLQRASGHVEKNLEAKKPKPEKTDMEVKEEISGNIGFSKRVPVEKVPDIRGQEVKLTFSFAGDCTLGTDESFPYVNSFLYRLKMVNNDYSYFFKGVKSIFEADDMTLVNLETTLTTVTRKAEKKFRFKGDPSYVNILKEGSVEMVNISNNHIFDYLEKGYTDTLKYLKQAGIFYSGEGNITFQTIKNIRVASLGYTGWSTSIKKSVSDDIRKTKEKADLILVSFHWGEERKNYPNETQQILGRFCIDQGADIVIGHHPHVIQGIEKYRDKYIVYSLGNFCFGGNRNPSDKDCFIFQNEFSLLDRKIVRSVGRIIPCSVSSVREVNDYQPRILEGEDKKRVLKRIYEYGKKLKYGLPESEI